MTATEPPQTWHPDGPGSFRAPAHVHRVTDARGRTWIRSRPLETRWGIDGQPPFIRWLRLVDEHGPISAAKE